MHCRVSGGLPTSRRGFRGVLGGIPWSKPRSRHQRAFGWVGIYTAITKHLARRLKIPVTGVCRVSCGRLESSPEFGSEQLRRGHRSATTASVTAQRFDRRAFSFHHRCHSILEESRNRATPVHHLGQRSPAAPATVDPFPSRIRSNQHPTQQLATPIGDQMPQGWGGLGQNSALSLLACACPLQKPEPVCPFPQPGRIEGEVRSRCASRSTTEWRI